MGVERYDLGHAMQVADTLQIMRPRCLLTQTFPDHPMFISSSKAFFPAWTEFLTGKGGKFLVKPRPESLQDTLLNPEKIGIFFRSVLMNSPAFSFHSSNVAYSKHPSYYAAFKESTLQADCFLTALLFHANNPSIVSCSAAADLPELVYRDQIVRQLELSTVSEYFSQYFDELDDKIHDFDFRKLDPELMLKPKSAYLAEALRQLSMTYGLVAAVVDVNLLPTLIEEWEKLSPQVQELKTFMDIPKPKYETSYLEYIEKHVMIEIMLGLFIETYFTHFNIFPYTGTGMIGVDLPMMDQFKEGWKYYYLTHSEKLKSHIDLILSSNNVGPGTVMEKEQIRRNLSKVPEKQRHAERKRQKRKRTELSSDEDM